MIDGVLERVADLRRLAYRRGLLLRHRVAAPVISIGALSFGGVGKTPITAWIAAQLMARGVRTGIVCSGYKGTMGPATAPVSTSGDGRVLGDEAVLLKHRLPQALVIRGRDKLGAARVAVELGAEMVVIDDGFQHQRLERDLDIVLLDDGWQRPFSRSYRREGNRALFDADLLWHHQRGPYTPSWDASASGVRVDVCSTIRPVGLFDRVGRRQATASELQGRKVAAMAAIARPQPFFDLLGQLGAEIVFRAGFADHRAFPESAIIEAKRQRPEVLICTEKDLVRGAADHGFVALRTEIGLTKGKQLVTSRLDELVCGC